MSYPSEVLADSPRVYLRMQEASGLIQDSSGLAHHATSSGGTFNYHKISPITNDPSDWAIQFNASWFRIPDHADLDLGDVGTVEMWLKRDATDAAANEHTITAKNTSWFLTFVNDKLTWGKSGVGYICQQTGTFTDTTLWHHVACTKNAAINKIYLDGVDVTSTVSNLTWADSALDMFVGDEDSSGTNDFVGQIDELAIYATALTQARLQAHINAATAVAAVAAPPITYPTAGMRW